MSHYKKKKQLSRKILKNLEKFLQKNLCDKNFFMILTQTFLKNFNEKIYFHKKTLRRKFFEKFIAKNNFRREKIFSEKKAKKIFSKPPKPEIGSLKNSNGLMTRFIIFAEGIFCAPKNRQKYFLRT